MSGSHLLALEPVVIRIANLPLCPRTFRLTRGSTAIVAATPPGVVVRFYSKRTRPGNAPFGYSHLLSPGPRCDAYPVTLADLSALVAKLDGVSERRREGLLDWRYRGRLVARQLDDSHIVIRATFELRDLLRQSFPETFSVPTRFAKHMMVVADIEHGDADAVEDAVIAAWELQSGK
jgi:hypothetical protein